MNDFTGSYSVGNWTTTTTIGGSVDTSNAPNSITINEPDDGSAGKLFYTITAEGAGIVTFNYDYLGTDFCCGQFGTVVNGVETILAQASYASTATSGSVAAQFTVAQGDTFGFFSQTSDGIFGSTTLTISNFTAPSAVPLPASAALLIFALGGLGFARRNA